jgi:hypothetical protein
MIAIRIEDERGEPWGTADERTNLGNTHLVKWLLKCADISDTACLRFIDPYGNTTFNRAQAKVLLDELAAVQEKISAEAISAEVARKRMRLQKQGLPDSHHIWFPNASELDAFTTRLRAMIAIAVERQHLYIKFVGD